MKQAFLGFFLMSALISGAGTMAADKAHNTKEKEIILVGASIGKAWHIEQLANRENLPGYSFNYVGVNAFDKSPLVDQLIARKNKPDFVMIKECSTYFPGNNEKYQRNIENWVAQLKRAGIRPVLVTTAPVAEPSGFMAKSRITIKHLLGMRTWLDEITAYNAWLREYAARERLPLFDLEAVLRVSDSNKYLKKEYDSGDMVHLTDAAYKVMDREFAVFLRRLEGATVTAR